MTSEHRVSLLIELPDRTGELQRTLQRFSANQVNLTHIESRPAKDGKFDFYVDCEGVSSDPDIRKSLDEIKRLSSRLLVLDEKNVPWFPRHIDELSRLSDRVLNGGAELQADHPGFSDATYRQRRAYVDSLAKGRQVHEGMPVVDYTDQEVGTWRAVLQSLQPLHERYASSAYLDAISALHTSVGTDTIPSGQAVSDFLHDRTGFRLSPVQGLLSPRSFLNGLAFRVFFCTQYIRHHNRPLYTPEPDICHELIGHAPMFADPAFAELSQEIGLASLGASDEDIERLARCYWFSVEFGMVSEGGHHRAYGAGLLSSAGELEYACTGRAKYLEWDPETAAGTDYPITEFQPRYFVADSLQDATTRMRNFCRLLNRPFYARYNPDTQRIWVDRAVNRSQY